MQKLFGIPVEDLALALAIVCALLVGVVGALALRNRVFFRLGARNLTKRRGRTALIVTGLMLATAIISSALSTGDTISSTIRSTAVTALGHADEVVSVRGGETQGFAGIGYFDEALLADVERAAAEQPLVDGVAPAIIEPAAVLDLTSRQTEPQATLFASDAARLDGFGEIRDVDGGILSLADLGAGEIYVNQEAAEELSARPGDELQVFTAAQPASFRISAVVDYEGTGSATPDQVAVLLPLDVAQALLGREGEIKHVLVSNAGDELDGARHSDAVIASLAPALEPLGLEISPAKQDALELADEVGNGFMTFFTTFGTFSIAAGVLLVFLIFVMLAAERRGELGIARAVGTRRGHLVQMFLFEGVAYDLVAAAIGALLGIGIAYGMVLVMAKAFGSTGLEIRHAVSAQSVVIAYCLGVLLTFVVVTFSAWRVSMLNIVSAIRNLPSPRAARGRRRGVILGILGVGLGVLLTASGVSGEQATPFLLGISLAIISLVPLVQAVGLPERAAFTGAAVLILAVWLMPTDVIAPDYKMDFSIWIAGGIVIVIAASWIFVHNADLTLRAFTSVAGRVRVLAPIARLSAAYPLRNRFRTGTTLAMFTLVVFTLVVAVTNTNAFLSAFDDVESYGGGFDVRATTPVVSPIDDLEAAVREVPGVDPASVEAVASASLVSAEARQAGTTGPFEAYPVRGADDGFLEHTTYALAATAEGYASTEEVWAAMRATPGLAVVDALVVPRRANWNFGPPPDFRLEGFYLEDRTFDAVPIEVRDPETGTVQELTVIGVLADTAPLDMTGITTSQATLEPFGERAHPSVHFLALAPGTDAAGVARALESAFLANGMEADAMQKLLDDEVAASQTFTQLMQGFVGLGLVVGVAALGVISARSVVERRQQIGVLRAIGFQRRMIQASFLLESSFIALGSIVLGTALGLVIANNVIDDAREQPSWENMSFAVPWASLGIIFAIVYAVALATTLLPARRASRVYPAEALRYR